MAWKYNLLTLRDKPKSLIADRLFVSYCRSDSEKDDAIIPTKMCVDKLLKRKQLINRKISSLMPLRSRISCFLLHFYGTFFAFPSELSSSVRLWTCIRISSGTRYGSVKSKKKEIKERLKAKPKKEQGERVRRRRAGEKKKKVD